MSIKIAIDKAKLQDVATIGEIIDFQEGNLGSIISIAAHFVVGEDGSLLSHAEGLKLIRGMKLSEFKDAQRQVSEGIKDEMVPPTNGAESETPS